MIKRIVLSILISFVTLGLAYGEESIPDIESLSHYEQDMNSIINRDIRVTDVFKGLASQLNKVKYFMVKNNETIEINSEIILLEDEVTFLVKGIHSFLAVVGNNIKIKIENETLLLDKFTAEDFKIEYLTSSNKNIKEYGYESHSNLPIILRQITKFINLIYQKIEFWAYSSAILTLILFAFSMKIISSPIMFFSIPTINRITKLDYIIKHELRKIKTEFSGEKAHYATLDTYKKYGVTPFYHMRAFIFLLLQITLLIPVYFVLIEEQASFNHPLLFIQDLRFPDGNFIFIDFLESINVLPFFMFIIMVILSLYNVKNKSIFDANIYIIPVASFFLLYSFPSNLVIYWIFSFIFGLIIERIVKLIIELRAKKV